MTEDDEPAFTVTESAHEIGVDELPTSPKGVFKKSLAAGWKTAAFTSARLVAETRFIGSGELKREAHEERTYGVSGVHESGKIAFMGRWSHDVDRKKTGFEWILVQDPLGVLVELFFDYKVSAGVRKQMGKERADAAEYSRDLEYNDGTSYLAKRHMFTQARPFPEWFDEWIRMLKPKQKEE